MDCLQRVLVQIGSFYFVSIGIFVIAETLVLYVTHAVPKRAVCAPAHPQLTHHIHRIAARHRPHVPNASPIPTVQAWTHHAPLRSNVTRPKRNRQPQARPKCAARRKRV